MTKDEKALINRNLELQEIALMLLSLEENFTYEQIAEHMEISVPTLKRWMATEEFEQVWNDIYTSIQVHPMIQATQAKVVELLPDALRTISETMQSGSPTVRLRAALAVIDLADARRKDDKVAERSEVAEFLKNVRGVKIDNMTINLPPDYQEAMDKHVNVVEGKFKPVDEEKEDD